MWKTSFFFYVCLGVTLMKFGHSDENGKVCDGEQCEIAATIINNAMDKTADPCDNFYNYACGGWELNYPLPNAGEVWNLEEMTEENALLEVKEILEEEDKEDDFTPLKYERLIYKSCMDTDRIEEVGLEPVESIINSLGGWPITMDMDDWSDENNEWQKIDGYFMKFKDLSSFFDIDVLPDGRDSSANMIMIDIPSVTLFDILVMDVDNETALAGYTEFVKDVVSEFIKSSNKSVTGENVMKDVEDIVAFEKSLRAIKFPETDASGDSEPSPTYLTIEDLQKFYDTEDMKSTAQINWFQLISSLFEDVENVSIDESEEVGVEDTSYLRGLSNLLDETPNRIIVNYIYWRFISLSMEYLNEGMQDLLVQIEDDSDEDVTEERWEECRDNMGLGLGYRREYVKRHFSEDTRKMVETIVSEVRNEMIDEMEHSTWIDEDTKDFSIAKLHDLRWRIGNSWFLKQDSLEHLYDDLEMTTDYFENIQQVRKFKLKRDLKKLRNKHKHPRFVKLDPLWATTIYDHSRNILALSAGQLAVPLMGASLPSAVYYGYIAPTLSRLVAQTMDQEVETDSYIRPWYSDSYEIREPYQAKTECFASQYGNYSSESSNLSEDIYDNIGLKVAYNVFKNIDRIEDIGKLSELEDLTDDQIFFVSFAQRYCETTSPEYLEERNFLSLTPNEYRVMGAVSNSKDFATVFNCAADTPMNPVDKCEV